MAERSIIGISCSSLQVQAEYLKARGKYTEDVTAGFPAASTGSDFPPPRCGAARWASVQAKVALKVKDTSPIKDEGTRRDRLQSYLQAHGVPFIRHRCHGNRSPWK